MNRLLLPFVLCGWVLAGLSLALSQPSDPPTDVPPAAPPAPEDGTPPDAGPPGEEVTASRGGRPQCRGSARRMFHETSTNQDTRSIDHA